MKESRKRRSLLNAMDKTDDPASKKQLFNQYLGELYRETVKEIDEEIQGKRPIKCGWFKDRLEEARAKRAAERGEKYEPKYVDDSLSDDDQVVILLKDGREFSGTRRESKKWLEENGINSTK